MGAHVYRAITTVVGATLLLVSGPLFAADSLTWEQCVAKASSDNPEIVAARNTLQGAEYSVRGAFSGFFPQLSASLSYSHGTGASSSAGAGASSLSVGGGASRESSTWTASLV